MPDVRCRTDRGHPVGWLVLVPRIRGGAELAVSGRLMRAVGDALGLRPPLAPAPGAPPASQALAQAGASER